MNRQPNGHDLSSNSTPSSLKKKMEDEPSSLKADILLHASSTSLGESTSTNFCDSQLSFDQSTSSISQSNDESQARQRLAMTENFLLKALMLDRR
jgi:hypothetical protein